MFKDAFGRRLQQGDYVTYGKSFGRCAGLGVGRVLAVREGMTEGFKDRDTYEWGKIPSGKFVLDVMTLQGWHPIKEPDRCTKTTLQFEERVLRINSEDLPSEQWAILNEAYLDYLINGKPKKEKK